MVITSYYNDEKKTLMLCTSKDYKFRKIKNENKNDVEVIKIYNEDDILIGVNYLNYENDSLKTGIVNNEDVLDLIHQNFGEDIDFPFVVGYVTEIKKHPKSEKLNICQVNLKDEQVQIVCGAQNVKEGIKVIVSKVGAVMPNGLIIKASKLLDEPSNGMITSLYELGYSKTSGNGIHILDDSYEIGSCYYE